MPDWVGNFQNPDCPALFAEYAGAFARRFPWVRFYTPVNEMLHLRHVLRAIRLVERAADHATAAFVTALKHIVRANVLAMQAILKVRPDAIFIQSESSEYFHAENPAGDQARPRSSIGQRFLSLDLNYGHDVDCEHVRVPDGQRHDAGQSTTSSCSNRLKHHCIMGNDYYVTNEHRVSAGRQHASRRARSSATT